MAVGKWRTGVLAPTPRRSNPMRWKRWLSPGRSARVPPRQACGRARNTPARPARGPSRSSGGPERGPSRGAHSLVASNLEPRTGAGRRWRDRPAIVDPIDEDQPQPPDWSRLRGGASAVKPVSSSKTATLTIRACWRSSTRTPSKEPRIGFSVAISAERPQMRHAECSCGSRRRDGPLR